MHRARSLDLKGLKCPLPALKTRQALATLAPGDVLEVSCTDPMSVVDIPHLVRELGHELVGSTAAQGEFLFRVRRLAASAGAS